MRVCKNGFVFEDSISSVASKEGFHCPILNEISLDNVRDYPSNISTQIDEIYDIDERTLNFVHGDIAASLHNSTAWWR